MVRHHDIPRTLRGVGGIRLIDHPGVHYPQHILNAPPGMNKRTGLPYELPPEGSVSTAEAARLLGISISTARGLLHRRGVNFCIVKHSSGQLRVYWRRSCWESAAARCTAMSGAANYSSSDSGSTQDAACESSCCTTELRYAASVHTCARCVPARAS